MFEIFNCELALVSISPQLPRPFSISISNSLVLVRCELQFSDVTCEIAFQLSVRSAYYGAAHCAARTCKIRILKQENSCRSKII